MRCLVIALACLLSYSVFGQDCVDVTQINPNNFCLDIYAPVCGCDGVTYSNDCYAMNYGGVTSWVDGECSEFDVTPPSLEVPQDLTLECSDDVPSQNVMAEDDSGEVFVTETSQIFLGSCSQNYVEMITYVATDPSGNTTSATQTITFADTSAPVWDLFPQSVVVPCDGMGNQSNLDSWLENMAGALASDNCSDVIWEVTSEVSGTSLYCFELSVTTLAIAIVDECGNVTTASATFTIEPLIEPAVPCADFSGVDVGECDMVLGVGRLDGSCTYISGCGAVVGNVDYSTALYSTIEECVFSCNEECISQEFLDMGVMIDCAQDYTPVCGCDRNTYSNICHAMYVGGNVSWTEGECYIVDWNGCLDPLACNYTPDAYAEEEGSCDYSCLCSEDINYDGVISVTDILALLGQFGCTSSCSVDLNADDATNVQDLLLLLAAFGEDCN